MLKHGDVVDRYRIVEVLGEGGMGRVYTAHDERLQRTVALKILRPPTDPQTAPITGGAARMLREARSAAALEHPNVVAVFDVGEVTLPGQQEATSFIAMELVRGRSLRAYIGDASIEVARKIGWLAQIARALDAAHGLGLVHRDIKPENVMIRDDDTVKVLDFGIAKRALLPAHLSSTTAEQIIPTLTAAGMAIGSPLYMSPEQMRGEPLDGRCDQFAWGVVAYELLGGRLPWGQDLDALKLVAALLSKEVSPLDEQALDLPPNVSATVQRTLAKSPEARFASMADVLRSLDIPLSPTGRSPLSMLPSHRPPRARRPLPLALAAVVVAVIGVAAFAAFRPKSPAPTSLAASARECAANASCIEAHHGEPFLCRKADGRCVSLASVDCVVKGAAPDWANDDTVWFGSMFPLMGGDAQLYGRSNAQAVDLARQDFAATLATMSTRKALGQEHPLGLVECDDAADSERAARHLIDDVGVPAIIGFRSGVELIDLSGSLIPKGVLAIATLTSNPLITTLPQPAGQARLVWRTTFSTAEAADAVSALVGDVLEPQLRDGSKPMRVALVRNKARNLFPISEALLGRLRFNGKSALENDANYRELLFDPHAADHAASDYASIANALLLYQPHIVLYTGESGLAKAVIEPVEGAWHASYKPRWINLAVLPSDLFPFIGKNAERRHRFFGITTTSTTMANVQFVHHYNEVFSDKITRTNSPNSSYDAFYLLAYATYALGTEPVTGPALARAFARLVPPGRSIDVGIPGIFEAYSTLKRGENVDLGGATGRLDFDLATGESSFDQAILCVAVDDQGSAFDSLESGLVYDAATKKLRGAMRCP